MFALALLAPFTHRWFRFPCTTPTWFQLHRSYTTLAWLNQYCRNFSTSAAINFTTVGSWFFPLKGKSCEVSNHVCRRRNWPWIFWPWSVTVGHCLLFLQMFQNKNVYLELNSMFHTKQSADIWELWIQKSANFNSIWVVHPFAIFQLPNHNPKAGTIIYIPLNTATKPVYVSLYIQSEAIQSGKHHMLPSQKDLLFRHKASCIHPPTL